MNLNFLLKYLIDQFRLNFKPSSNGIGNTNSQHSTALNNNENASNNAEEQFSSTVSVIKLNLK